MIANRQQQTLDDVLRAVQTELADQLIAGIRGRFDVDHDGDPAIWVDIDVSDDFDEMGGDPEWLTRIEELIKRRLATAGFDDYVFVILSAPAAGEPDAPA